MTKLLKTLLLLCLTGLALLGTATIASANPAVPAVPATSPYKCIGNYQVGPGLCATVYGTNLHVKYVNFTVLESGLWKGSVGLTFRNSVTKKVERRFYSAALTIPRKASPNVADWYVKGRITPNGTAGYTVPEPASIACVYMRADPGYSVFAGCDNFAIYKTPFN